MEKTTVCPLGSVGTEPLIARYRHWFDHERDANAKMLDMLETVPEPARADAKFERALKLAGHLAACRENHLAALQGREGAEAWFPESVELASLRPRFAALEVAWSAYLDSLTDKTLVQDIELLDGDYRYLWNVEGQVFQLLGHAWYHRGQIALLVDDLGGTTVDTDYVDWVYPMVPRFA